MSATLSIRGVPPGSQVNMAIGGDSVTADWADGTNWVGKPAYMNVYDVARGGSTIYAPTGGNNLPGARSLMNVNLGTGDTRNIAVLAGGINDYNFLYKVSPFLSLADIIAAIDSIIALTRSDGWQAVYFAGLQPASPTLMPTYESTFRPAINAALTARVGLSLDGMIPLHLSSAYTSLGLPDLSLGAAADNLTYWGSDGIHPTGTGAGILNTVASTYLMGVAA